MTIHVYQIIMILVAIVMISQGVKNYIRGRSGQTLYKLAIRIVVWGGMGLIAIFPDFSNFLANIVGIKGNINAVILTGFILTFLMIFKLLSAIERLEQQISEVTRDDSLKELKSEK
ncbi:MAG: hypothetical protein UY41_C0031G0004 [Candidatus Moranbacteria bacterium GW2011_GWE1_49_15]|nr:MAG: hypothetical protein UX75_C0015G0005 [Candidatus Moranbacteria bacterium GW2011_GWE2_47_10]KKW06287.1 MAG: hypothetical protein UY41_C0031G0004 [Candidatus Moranbacteria bacterium GW2011_GWE1_49_15]HBP00668.1 hypothetical protein [Candidatus Moranbacteria bacterium]